MKKRENYLFILNKQIKLLINNMQIRPLIMITLKRNKEKSLHIKNVSQAINN